MQEVPTTTHSPTMSSSLRQLRQARVQTQGQAHAQGQGQAGGAPAGAMCLPL
jgi:hypothetical protein